MIRFFARRRVLRAAALLFGFGAVTGFRHHRRDAGNTLENIRGRTRSGRRAPKSLGDLSDVDTAATTPRTGDVLKWDDAVGRWMPGVDLQSSAGAGDSPILNIRGDFGAVGDGVTDDRAAFASAEKAGHPVGIGPGAYHIDSDITLTVPLYFLGGRLLVGEGAAITITGPIHAPPTHIFDGAGTIAGPAHRATEVIPEWFGCAGDADLPNATDDTSNMQRAIRYAGQGGTVRFVSMYAVRELRVGITPDTNSQKWIGSASGIAEGREGNNESNARFFTGLALHSDADFMVKFAVGDWPYFGNVYENLLFDGRDKTVGLGLVWFKKSTAGRINQCSFRRVRGPVWYVNNLVDMRISDSFIGYGGDENNVWGFKALICQGFVQQGGSIGTNVVMFHNCRFEAAVAGFFANVPTPAESPDPTANKVGWAVTYQWSDCKFESNNGINNLKAGETSWYGEVQTSDLRYGTFASVKAHPWFDFASEGQVHATNNIRISDNHFNGVNNPSVTFKFNHGNEVLITNNNFALARWSKDNDLFELSGDIKGFVFKDNTYADLGVDRPGDFVFKFTNTSRYPIVFEYPHGGNNDDATSVANMNVANLIDVSRAGWPGRMVADPAGDSIGIGKTVAAGTAGQELCRVGGSKNIQTAMGISSRLPGGVNLKCRVKKDALGGTSVLQLYGSVTGGVVTAPVTSTSWEWVDLPIAELDRELDPADDLVIKAKAGNNRTIYLDVIRVDYT